MKCNQAGIDLIKQFEGCRLKAYKDIIGVITIGYGHTGKDIYIDMEINQAAADMFLEKDLARFEDGVKSLLTPSSSINENQFSALVCFAFNVGLGNLKSSTLLKLANSGDFSSASQQFGKWCHAGEKKIPGLVRRRLAEKALFCK